MAMVKKKNKVVVYKRVLTAPCSNPNVSIQYLVIAGMRSSPRAKNGLFIVDREERFLKNTEGNEHTAMPAGPYKFKLSSTYELQNTDETISLYCDDFDLPISISHNNFKRILLNDGVKDGVVQGDLYYTDKGWLSPDMISAMDTKTTEWNTSAAEVLKKNEYLLVKTSDLIPGQTYREPVRIDTDKQAIYTDCSVYLGELKINGNLRYCFYKFNPYEEAPQLCSSDVLLSSIARTHVEQWAHKKFNIHPEMFVDGTAKDLLEKRMNLRYLLNPPELYKFKDVEARNFNVLDIMQKNHIKTMYGRLSRPWWMLKQPQGIDAIQPFDTNKIFGEIQARLEKTQS